MKKLLLLLLCTGLFFQTNYVVANASTGNYNTKTEGKKVITDRNTIEKMAEQDGINPNSVNKIIINEYELNPTEIKNVPQSKINAKRIKTTTHINNIKDKGTYYYPSQYSSDSIQGPASVNNEYSVSGTAEITAGISIPSSVFEANFGVTIGHEDTFTKSLHIEVPSGKVNNIRYYVNYRKKTYDIYYEYSNSKGLWYPQGSGETMLPCGIVVRQYV